MKNFYSYMGMADVVIGPDGLPTQMTGKGFELSPALKQFCTAGVLSAAIAVPATGSIPQLHTDFATSAVAVGIPRTVAQKMTLADQIAFCRFQFSLNMKQMAEILKRERQTLYSWIAGSSQPQGEIEQRLDTVVFLAKDWLRQADQPVGKASARKLSNGQTLFEMLTAEKIDPFQIRPLFPELKHLVVEKSPGETRRERAAKLEYEGLSKEQRSARLRANLPI